jgi:hypothetical protein
VSRKNWGAGSGCPPLCATAATRKLPCMAREAEPRLSEAEPTQFGLDVELDSEPIQGSVYEDGTA